MKSLTDSAARQRFARRRASSSSVAAMATAGNALATSPHAAEAIRLAVVRSAAVGVLSPLDLAALDIALRPAMPSSSSSLREDAAEAAARGHLPSLHDSSAVAGAVDAAGRPRPPRGATSWTAVHRRAYVSVKDCRLAVASGGRAQDVAARVDDDGTLWTWGGNETFLLGLVEDVDDDSEDDEWDEDIQNERRLERSRGYYATPRRVAFPPTAAGAFGRVRVAGISLGAYHALACDATGRAWSWGGRPVEWAAMGDRDVLAALGRDVGPKERFEKYQVHGLVEFADGGGAATPFVVSVAAGARHSVAVDVAGDAYAWGSDSKGQLGLGYDPDAIFGVEHEVHDRYFDRATKVRALSYRGVRVVLAAAGRHVTMYLDEDGFVYKAFCNAATIGYVAVTGEHGQRQTRSSIPRREEHIPPMTHLSIGTEHALAVDRDGGLWGFGDGRGGLTGRVTSAFAGPSRRGVFRRVASDADAVRASRAYAGESHSVVLTRDGRLVGFGDDRGGALPYEDDGFRIFDSSLPRFLAAPRREGRDDHAPHVVTAVACGGFTATPPSYDAKWHKNALCVAVSAEDGQLYAWGTPGPWLGTSWNEDLRGPVAVFE